MSTSSGLMRPARSWLGRHGIVVWILALSALLIWPELPGHRTASWLTLGYPVAYVALSFWLGGAFRRGSR